MCQWIRSHLTYANVMVTILAFVVLTGGTAVALNGSNSVQSDDLGPGAQVKQADVADNAVVSGDIKNGEVSVRDTNKVIPSGATVTGAFREFEDDSGSNGGLAQLQFGVDFYGLRAPQALTDADINFHDVGISADAAANGQESGACTGGLGIPTAPPGKVCIYLSLGDVNSGSAYAEPLGYQTGFNHVDDKGFFIQSDGPNTAGLGGSWAYTAP